MPVADAASIRADASSIGHDSIGHDSIGHDSVDHDTAFA